MGIQDAMGWTGETVRRRGEAAVGKRNRDVKKRVSVSYETFQEIAWGAKLSEGISKISGAPR